MLFVNMERFVQTQLQPTEQAPVAMTPAPEIPRAQAIREYPLGYNHTVDDAFLKTALDAFAEHAGQPLISVDDALHLVTDAGKLSEQSRHCRESR